MSRNKRSDKKAWSKQFAEEYDDLEYVSRSERTRGEKKKNSEGMSPMLTGTVIFLAVLILAVIFYYIWFTNRPSDQQKILDEPEIESTMRDKSEEEEKEKKEQEEKEKKEQEEKEKKEQKEKEKKEQEEKEKKEQEEQERQEQEEKERQEQEEREQEERERQEQEEREQEEQDNQEPEEETETGNTYTVAAGDNMYRIALNHGMTTEELMELNGLSDESVHVGQVLKVK